MPGAVRIELAALQSLEREFAAHGDDWLTQIERERVASMRSVPRRRQFLAGHWLARRLAAQHSGGSPRDWHWQDGDRRRSVTCAGGLTWCASIAHSGDWLRQAVDAGRGCDAIIVSGLAVFVGLSAADALGVPAIGAMLIPISPTSAFASPFLPFTPPRLFNHASDQRVEYGRRFGRGHELFGCRYGRNGRLLAVRSRTKCDQRDSDRGQSGAFSGLNDAHFHNSVFIREITAARRP